MENHEVPKRRRRGREIALQVLYALDLCPDTAPDSVFEFYPEDAEDPQALAFARQLVLGTSEHRSRVDELVKRYTVGWRPERMVTVDRVAVRLALFEGVVAKRIPIAVAISEAVELAKMFGTEDSGRFVNGVLGRIIRNIEAEAAGTDYAAEHPDQDSQ
ncbi:MAG: transcription antitermination factor NusB [Synergistales bacterium]|nr:transcription antitermination factor NusB [Synergistales bacterium]